MSFDVLSVERRHLLRALIGGCLAMIAGAVVLAAAGQGAPARIDVRVGVAPTPFRGSDGQTHLATN